jgi:hypothetical protein
MESVVGHAVKSPVPSVAFTQTLAGELKPMGVVNKAIQDRVGQSGVPNQVMPRVHGNLARHYG